MRYRLPGLPLLFLALALLATAPAAEARSHVTIRGHHGGHGHGGVYHYGHYPYYGYRPYGYVGFSFGYPWYGYPYYGYPWYGYPGYGYPYPYYAPSGPPPDLAFLDTDVSPEKAMVYVDGEYVGTADDFDGYPRYLTVEPGDHVISFKAEGRVTVSQEVKTPRGALLRFNFTMAKPGKETQGKSAAPQTVIPAAPEPRDPEAGRAEPAGGMDLEEDPGERSSAAPGTLKLMVTPGDASIYLDGEFIGTGESIARLHGSLRLDSGRHVVEVARPGYRAYSRTLTVDPGERESLEILLEKD